MTIGINDVVRVVMTWDAPQSTVAQLVWHYVCTSGTSDDPADVLDDIVTNFETAWAHISAKVSDDYLFGLAELYLYDFSLHQFDSVAQDTSVLLDGASVADYTVHGAAALVKIYTASARRQARKYVFGLIESAYTDALVNAAALSDLAFMALDWDDDIVAPATTWEFCTFNVDATSPLYETTSIASQTVEAEAVPGYQRRRRPGTGI